MLEGMRARQSAVSETMVFIGLSLTWLVAYQFAYSFAFTPLDTFSVLQVNLSRVLYLGGIAASQIALCILAPRLATRSFRIPLALLATALLLIMPGSLSSPLRIIELNSWSLALSLPLAGMWQGVFHVLWSEAVMSTIPNDRRIVYGSIAVGGLIFSITALLPDDIVCILVIAVVALNLGVFALFDKSKPPISASSRMPSRKLTKSMRKSSACLSLLGAVFGVGIYACMTSDNLGFASGYSAIGIALACGALAMLLLDVVGGKTYKIDEISLALSPVIAVLLVLFIYLSGPATWLVYLALLAVLTALDGTAFCFQVRVAQELALNPLAIISRGRMIVQLGMFLAALANFALIFLSEQSGIADPPLLIPLVLVAFLFFIMATISKENLLPLDALNPQAPAEPDEPDAPTANGAISEEPQRSIARQSPDLRDVIRQIGEDFDLSSREIEVLELILAGNSTPAIAGKMFISQNTVKSHRYHIYRKMGVSSKQEIIDIRDQYLSLEGSRGHPYAQ